MAGHVNHGMNSRHSSLDHVNFGYDAYDNSNRLIVESDSMSRVQGNSNSEKINIFIIFVFILELLVLIFLSILEYFLRATTAFPIRQASFTCGDPELSYTQSNGESTFVEFAYRANVSELIIIPLCFCVAPVIILVSELALWGFTEEPQKMVRALCPQCRLPQVFRRIVRYIGTFLCGILITMIFVDVTKMFVGRFRPTFLSTCNPVPCTPGALLNVSDCTETDEMTVREASTSFPSMHAAITAYAGTFIGIYLHCIIRASSVRILRPFLSLGFILLSVMCCLARYGLHYSYWTDLAVGFGVGLIIALYMCISVLHHFRERMRGNRLYHHIRDFMFEQRALELQELYKEERLPYSSYRGNGVYAGGIILPRPQVHATNGLVNESTTDDLVLDNIAVQAAPSLDNVAKAYQPYSSNPSVVVSHRPNTRTPPSPATHDTFQRDLHRSLDHYRQNDFGHL